MLSKVLITELSLSIDRKTLFTILSSDNIKTLSFSNINSFDPFNNVMGKDAKNIEQKYYREKKVALKYNVNIINRSNNILHFAKIWN